MSKETCGTVAAADDCGGAIGRVVGGKANSVRLYLDDVRSPPDDGGGLWTICRTVDEAKALLLAGPVDEVSLDHDLGMTETGPGVWSDREAPTGYDLVRWMAEFSIWPRTKPRVHSANPVGAGHMRQMIERYWRQP